MNKTKEVVIEKYRQLVEVSKRELLAKRLEVEELEEEIKLLEDLLQNQYQ